MKLTNKITLLLVSTLIIGCSSVDSKKLKQAEHSLLKGMNYAREQKYTEALKEYNKVLHIDSNNFYALKETARANAILKNYKESISFYKQALKINEKDVNSLTGISYVYYLTEDFSKALKYIKQIPLDELTVDTKLFKGLLLFKNNDEQEGVFEFEEGFSQIDHFDKEYASIYMTLLNKEKQVEKMRIFLEENKNKYSNNEDFVIFFAESVENYFYEFDIAEEMLKRYIATYGGNDNLYVALAKTIYNGQKTKNSKREKKQNLKDIEKQNNTTIKGRLRKSLWITKII